MNLSKRIQNSNNPRLSVVIIFYNMRREAARTLYSLGVRYQREIAEEAYEVIAIDNGSSEPLDEDWVKSFGKNFKYIYFDANTPSPCQALNYGVQMARGELVTICIDGARILSPNILNYSIKASAIFDKPFVYALGMHIGSKPQNFLAEENYTREGEDQLIASTRWEEDGYELFNMYCVALSSGQGFFSALMESKCFALRRSMYLDMDGLDENFSSPGGGLTNLDFFFRAGEIKNISPVMLLGEVTSHQFHGGAATNVARKDHPWKQMAEEYKKIRKKEYQPVFMPPYYFGGLHARCIRLLTL